MAYTASNTVAANFRLENFDYQLPKELIATRPHQPITRVIMVQ